MKSFLHLFSVGTAEFTETGATAFCRWVSVLNILHENLGTICECSSAVILVQHVHTIQNYLCGSFTVLMLRVSHIVFYAFLLCVNHLAE